MLKATDNLFTAVKNVDRELDTMEWKVSKLEEKELILFDGKKVIASDNRVNCTTYQLIKDVSKVDKDCDQIKSEMIQSIDILKKSSQDLESKLDTLKEKFNLLTQYISH